MSFCVRVSLRMRRSLYLALQQRHRRIEHDRGVDRALLHRRDRGGAKADADDADGVRIDAVLLQHDTSGR